MGWYKRKVNNTVKLLNASIDQRLIIKVDLTPAKIFSPKLSFLPKLCERKRDFKCWVWGMVLGWLVGMYNKRPVFVILSRFRPNSHFVLNCFERKGLDGVEKCIFKKNFSCIMKGQYSHTLASWKGNKKKRAEKGLFICCGLISKKEYIVDTKVE